MDIYESATGDHVGHYSFNHWINGSVNGPKGSSRQVPVYLRDLDNLKKFDSNKSYRFVLRPSEGEATGKATIQIHGPLSNAIDKVVGGLRIQEIKFHDGNTSANDIIKTYDYNQAGYQSKSSGMLFKFPKYCLEGFLQDPHKYATPTGIYFKGNNSVIPLTNYEG